jgi:hypothetical protein
VADDLVSMKRLAELLGVDRSYARRYAIRNGFVPARQRTADTGNQASLAWSKDDVERLLALRAEQGFSLNGEDGAAINTEHGWFYVIQLVPELDARRIKLGFACSVEQRLCEHRTAAPTAQLAGKWPCRRSWEQTVIAALTADGCRLLLNEVFECDDSAELLGRADRFFALLPSPDFSVPLAVHSPLAGNSDEPET